MHSGPKGWDRSRISVCLVWGLIFCTDGIFLLKFILIYQLLSRFLLSTFTESRNKSWSLEKLQLSTWKFFKVNELERGLGAISWGFCFLSFCAVVGQLPPSFPAHILRWQQGFNSWLTERETKDCERLTTGRKKRHKRLRLTALLNSRAHLNAISFKFLAHWTFLEEEKKYLSWGWPLFGFREHVWGRQFSHSIT